MATNQTEPSLTQDRLKYLLSYDPATGDFTRRKSRGAAKAEKRAGSIGSQGYLRIMVDGVLYQSHRLAWFYMTGAWPKSEIDHKNRIKHDNRWENLREAERHENACNQNRSKRRFPRGVRWNGFRYQAHITYKNKWYNLGTHATADEAAAAYKLAALRFRGDFG